MGLMNKLKNILFEVEEVEIPVIDKKEKKQEPLREPVYKEMPKKEEKVEKQNYYQDLEPVIKQENKLEEKNRERKNEDNYNSLNTSVSEREIFKSEKTFNFPAFDEKEFEMMSPRQKLRPSNIMEHERKVEVRSQEYRKIERKEETQEKVKFRPSPIISPVYGILDKNYTPDEITSRNDNELSRKLDVDSVRKKAFGVIDKKEEKEEKISDEQILEEKLEKARTIDELLKDSSDDVIDLNEDLDNDNLDEVPEILEEDNKEEIKHEDNLEDDTLENDLFDLIDSMYENREDGE